MSAACRGLPMRTKERLRRLESEVTKREGAAVICSDELARHIRNQELAIAAEIVAAVITDIVTGNDRSHQTAREIADRLAELRHTTREAGQQWTARVERIFSTARELRCVIADRRPEAARRLESLARTVVALPAIAH